MPKLLLALLLLIAQSAIAGEPTTEAQQIIERFKLREAPQALRDNPAWKPRKVLLALSPGFSALMPDLQQRLAAAAPGLELVPVERAQLAQQLADADALMGFCSPEILQQAGESFLWLHNFSAGVDRCSGLQDELIDGRIVSNSQRLMGPAIAEHAIGMLLSLSRSLPALQRAQADSQWDRSIAASIRFGELQGKTMLVVGLGGIGTEIARRGHGLGMRVMATRNSRREGPDFVEYVGLAPELHELAAKADVVVNALPLTESTRGLFDKAFFEAVKPGAIFISIGRGQSTVTAELVAALQGGTLYGAGLDVTDPEPLPPQSPLWQMDNVIITPHLSAAGPDSGRRVALVAIENLRRYAAGEPLLSVVDLRRGY